LVASQIACGEENSLKIKVYGEKEVWNGIKWNPILYWLNGLVVPVKSIEPEIVIYQIVPV
jgi:hypothetical protein